MPMPTRVQRQALSLVPVVTKKTGSGVVPVDRPSPLLPHTLDAICSGVKQHLLPSLDLLPTLGPQEVTTVLLRCQSDPTASLSFFHWAKSHHLHLTPHSHCVLAHVLAWSGRPNQAMAILSQLAASHPHPSHLLHALVASTVDCNWTPSIFGMLLKVLVKAGRASHGLDVFMGMSELGLPLTTDDCNCLMTGLLKINSGYRCWQVYNHMRDVGISPNSFTFNIMIRVLCTNGSAVHAREFLDEMRASGVFRPDVVTYNTLITGYCREGRIDDALYLCRTMYRRGVEPDLVSYTVLVSAMCKDGKVRDAHQLFVQMLQRDLQPDGVIYNVLVSGYSKECMMEEARSLLLEMVQSDFMLDEPTWSSLVEGYMRCGRLLSCLNLIAQLRNSGVFISYRVYKNLVSCLCKDNRPNAARNLLGLYPQNGYKPDLEIYSCLIKSFCSCDRISQALELKDEMVANGITPNIACYRDIISAFCRLGRSMEGEQLMWEMFTRDRIPDSRICDLIVGGYCKERRHNKAEILLVKFAKKISSQEITSHNTLIGVHCEEGNIVKALELQDKMLKLGIVPNGRICKLLIHGLSRTTRHGQEVVLCQ